jgi:hypothetical protein
MANEFFEKFDIEKAKFLNFIKGEIFTPERIANAEKSGVNPKTLLPSYEDRQKFIILFRDYVLPAVKANATEQVVNELCQRCCINQNDIPVEVRRKFLLYFECFAKLVLYGLANGFIPLS